MRRVFKILLDQPRGSSTRSAVWLITGNGHGSTNTKIRRFATVQKNVGTDITLAQSATDGDSMTINKAGFYYIYYQDLDASAFNIGISINSNELTTSIATVTAANVLARFTCGSGTPGCATIVTYLSIGDVIRAHDDASASATGATQTMFKVERVA